MPKRIVTLADLNRQNERFWSKETKLLAKRISQPSLALVALETLRDESLRGVPVYFRKTLEHALRDAERTQGYLADDSAGGTAAHYARLPRKKVLRNGTTIRQLIALFVCRPAHHHRRAKDLWRLFKEELQTQELEPSEISAKSGYSHGYEYRFGKRRSRITFKTFSNYLSNIRKNKSH